MQDIGWAVKQLRNGAIVGRPGWNGKGMWLELMPARGTIQAFVMMHTAQGTDVPWLCSQTDLLATDWEIAGLQPA